MNEVWNLDPIYKGFDDPAFEADIAAAKEKLQAFTAFSKTLAQQEPIEALRTGILLQEELAERHSSWVCMPPCASPPTPGTRKPLPIWAD